MPGTICLVTHDFEGIITVGGIGSYYSEVAKLLSQNGWEVAVLFHHYEGKNIEKFAEKYHENFGIPIYDANVLCEESGKSIQSFFIDSNWHQARSHIYHEAIQMLTTKHGYNFDMIEFPDWGAAAFIPTQMKKTGKHWNSKIMVKLHSPSLWHNEGCEKDHVTADELKLDYMERYSFENADIQVSLTQHLLQWCREHGWNVSNATICRYPVRELEIGGDSKLELAGKNEVTFFGRFEERKGTDVFIEALNYINSIDPGFKGEYDITFIGKEGTISKKYISEKLETYGYEPKFLMFPSRNEVIQYLINNARLVVCPSKLDNFPSTILECMGSRIPFVTSRAGGIPEILGVGSDLHKAVSCEVENPRDLGNIILRYLDYSEDYVKKILDLSYGRFKEITNKEKILQWYENILVEPYPRNNMRVTDEDAGVTIIIPHFNMHEYLETTLKSLINQTYDNMQIIVVDDGSTNPESISALDNLNKKYSKSKITFLRRDHRGQACTLNYALKHVNTKYVMEVDSDNIAKPEMVETFVKCIERRHDVVALSCYFAVFRDENEKDILDTLEKEYIQQNFVPNRGYYYKPIGPCLPLLFFENVQGDANSIYLTEVIKSIGGWSEGKGLHDMCFWIKLIANGYNVDVIPKILFYFRDRPNSEGKKKPRDVYDMNIRYIRSIIEKRPEFFSLYSYANLHYLMSGVLPLPRKISEMQEAARTREQELAQVQEAARTREQELAQVQEVARTREQELAQLRDTALNMLNMKLGEVFVRRPLMKSFLEKVGKIIKKLVEIS